MDDELNEILSEEGAGLTTYRAIIRVLVKMWQTAREEIRAATRAADRLRPVAAAATVAGTAWAAIPAPAATPATRPRSR